MDRVACAHPRGAIRIRTPIVGRRSGRRSVRGPTLALAAMNAMRARSDGLVRGAEHSSRLIVRPRLDAGGDGTLQDYATPNHLRFMGPFGDVCGRRHYGRSTWTARCVQRCMLAGSGAPSVTLMPLGFVACWRDVDRCTATPPAPLGITERAHEPHLTPLIYGCYVAIASIVASPLMRAGR